MRWVSSAPRPFAGAFLGAMLLGALTAMMLITAPARADVVTVVSVTGKGLGLSSSGQETTTVKGKQMRRDATERGKSISYLYDLENRSLTVLNHSRKEAEVFSMAALAGEVRKRTKAEKLELKIEPTGATKTLLGKACQEYSVEISVPARAAGGDVLVRQTGTAWLATGGVGGAEYSAFWKATSGGDLFLAIPSLAKSAPGQVLGTMAFYQRAAEIGPVYALNLDFMYEGAAGTAAVMKKTASSLAHKLESVSSDPVLDEKFAIPKGYTVTNR